MQIIIADCEVFYSGRGETMLPRGVRAILIKSDGAVSIHEDKGNKPLNYMPAGNTLTVTEYKHFEKWFFQNKKENILVKIFEQHHNQHFFIPENTQPLQRYQTEKQLQSFLKENPHPVLQYYGYDETMSKNVETITEYNTSAGSIDLLIHNHDAEMTHIVELKRTAMLGAVDQCVRYREAYMDTVNEKVQHYRVTVAVAAFNIRPNTERQAEKNNIDCITLNPIF